ncbi:MAG: GxxExxY protein [Pedobacter sp.]|nr:MAG: GxxExxY protein [Pedobacter sp.]
MTKREITHLSYQITGYAIKVHKSLGPGLLESVYEKCLVYELEKNGHLVNQQLSLPVFYDDIFINAELKLDLYVDNCIVVELKTVESLLPVHEAQILTYMKLLKAPQGLLINFFTDNISKSMKPFVNDYFNALMD